MMLTTLTWLMLSFQLNTWAPADDHVTWEFTSRQNDGITELVMTATVEKGWHIYSQFTPDGGPIPTEFKIESQKGVEVIGKVVEPKPEKHYDPNFQLEVMHFSNKVEFVQKVRVRGSVTSVKGKVSYMQCNDNMCLPPKDVSFEIKL